MHSASTGEQGNTAAGKARRQKGTKGMALAGGIMALLAVGGFVGWRVLVTLFHRSYYQENYAPLKLAADDIGEYPTGHHLQDVPWIATREWYCQSNTLAMIAAQHGIDASAGYCSFLMGFTYGAVEVPGSVGINPFTDPEQGFAVAAPYLGLVRRYYVTDDETLYLDALRYFLSQGHAVRLALDVAVLYDLERQLPHSDLLVGYDEDGFYYYETVCLPEFPCNPRHLPPGTQGLRVSDRTLLDAVLAQAKSFSYPWRYSLTLFEPGPPEDDQAPVWTRNGNLLIGGSQYGPRQGADAVDKLADVIERRGARLYASKVRWGLEAAVFTRRDNAAYLRAAFHDRGNVRHAADLFDRSADAYERTLDLLADGVADQAEARRIAAWLRQAAQAEREIGGILLAQGH
jgi:hypothetical protein